MPKDLEHFLVVSVEGGVLAGAILSHSPTYALAHYRRYCHDLNLDPNDPHADDDVYLLAGAPDEELFEISQEYLVEVVNEGEVPDGS
jgi:hypothetical protein